MEKYYFKVSDYLHIACSGNHSVKLYLSISGKNLGEIIIVDGILWNAFDEKGEGEDAFLRMIFSKETEVESLKIHEKDIKRGIFIHWEELLIKGVADRDKNNRSDLGKDSGKPEKDENIKVVLQQGLESLMKRDYKSAITIFSELNERYPGNLMIRSQLRKLKELGYREEVPPSE